MMDKKNAITAKSEQALSRCVVVRPITEDEKGYARAAVRLKVARTVWALWDQLRKEQGVDQTWLVERLDSNKGRVSRLLNGSGNWTLDTVADLLEAMGGRLTVVEVKRYSEIDVASRVEPSLSGMRDHPSLWSIMQTTFDAEENAQLPMLDVSPARFPLMPLATQSRVVSSETT